MLLLKKIFSLSTLTLLTALVLSGIAAWYSIIGLTAIFAAAAIPVIIMGAALETAKVVTTMWLHRFWKESGILIKLYLIPAVVVLAIITSMGVFGFLSKAHLEQSKPAGNNVAKIERIDLQVNREKRTIQDAEKIIAQLDQTVQVLMDAQRIRGPDGALAVRKSQQSERDNLTKTINDAQAKIDKLEDEKFELNVAVRDLKLEVGPIKYVAALIYEDADSNLENAVRIVIILLVVVFDPLALCLMIASLKAREIEFAELERNHNKPEPIVVDEIDHGDCYKCGTKLIYVPAIGSFCPNKDCDILDDTMPESDSDIPEPENIVIEDDIPVDPSDVILDEVESEEVKKKEPIVEEELHIEPLEFIPEVKQQTKENPTYREVDGGYVIYEDKLYKKEALKEIQPSLFVERPDSLVSPSTGFGTHFPKTAFKGDIFVRVDVLPNKVFKFDGTKWIEINKTNTDSYLYDKEYIKYLIEKISKEEYDIELLSDNERYQIEEYLKLANTQDK